MKVEEEIKFTNAVRRGREACLQRATVAVSGSDRFGTRPSDLQ